MIPVTHLYMLKSGVGFSSLASLLIRVRDKAIEAFIDDFPLAPDDVFTEPESQMPMQDRVVDKLADMLYASDMILDMLGDDRYYVPEHLRRIEPSMRRLYTEVNDLMKALTD